MILFYRIRGVLAVLAALAASLAPVWAYLFVRAAANPEGFMEEFLLGVAGVWALGTIQLFFLVAWLFGAFAIWGWTDDAVRAAKRRAKQSL